MPAPTGMESTFDTSIPQAPERTTGVVISARVRFGSEPLVSKEMPAKAATYIGTRNGRVGDLKPARPALSNAISQSPPRRLQACGVTPAPVTVPGVIELHRTAGTRKMSADKSALMVVQERRGPEMGQAKTVTELVAIEAQELVDDIRDQLRTMSVVPIDVGRILRKAVLVNDRAVFADNRIKLARTSLHDVTGIRTIDERCRAAETDVRDFDFGPEAA